MINNDNKTILEYENFKNFFSFQTVPQDAKQIMLNHITEVRKKPGLENSTLVFIMESNLGWDAIECAEFLRRHETPRICYMREDQGRIGIKTTEYSKEEMARGIKHKLQDNAICFHRNFFCMAEDMTPEKLKEEFGKQLKNFKRKTIKIGKQIKVRYNGKGGYGFDDLVIALGLNNYMRSRFFNQPAVYQEYI